LKYVFFKPLGKVLHDRYEATEGARKAAAASLARAEERAAAYEASIRAARSELYKEQEEQRRKWRDEQTAQMLESRKRAEALIAQAKADLGAQAEQAKRSLATDTDALAEEIVNAVLHRRAA
jgi:F-type H+-transporting ATPase subunit b